MRKEIRELIKARHLNISMKKLEKQQIKEDFSILLKAGAYEKIVDGRHKGKMKMEVLTDLYWDTVTDVRSMTKQQLTVSMRLLDQFLGKGEVAKEQKEIAAQTGPNVLYVAGSKREPQTIPAEVVPTLGE